MVDGEGVTLHRHLLQGRSVLHCNASSTCDVSDDEECVGQLRQRVLLASITTTTGTLGHPFLFYYRRHSRLLLSSDLLRDKCLLLWVRVNVFNVLICVDGKFDSLEQDRRVVFLLMPERAAQFFALFQVLRSASCWDLFPACGQFQHLHLVYTRSVT